MERYGEKRAVIIGGTSGMGLATAKMLLDGGARVLVTGLSKAGLESAQKELGKDALVVSSDARSLTEIDAGHLDDGLPRGFLSGAIVEVWVTLRLNWACGLPLSRGEELP